MKLCFLTGEYPPMQGGVADHTAQLAHHLAWLGVEVSILTTHQARPAALAAGPPPSVSVYPCITGWGLNCWREIGRFLAEHHPEVLHIQYQAAAYDLTGWVNGLPWRLRRRSDRPRSVVTFHDLRVPYLFPKAGWLRRQAILWLARYADAVITTNAEDEARLRQYPWASHVQLIPLGSNIEPQPPPGYDRDSWRTRLGVPEGQLLLAYFGFLNQSKGGEDLVLALEQLVRRGYHAGLLMIGGQVGDVDPTNQTYADHIHSLINERRLDSLVHWTGYTSPAEVSANLLAADIVVMPYRDGVSFRRTTFIAALRHGRPVITTQPAIPLAGLCDGENVLLVPPQAVAALADAMTRLADDATLRARLATGARALGHRFDWSEIAQQTRGVYARLGCE
jgi:glycosyltransferase involved in cell wall biosynthesis